MITHEAAYFLTNRPVYKRKENCQERQTPVPVLNCMVIKRNSKKEEDHHLTHIAVEREYYYVNGREFITLMEITITQYE